MKLNANSAEISANIQTIATKKWKKRARLQDTVLWISYKEKKMDAVRYLEIKKRMCEEGCSKCHLASQNNDENVLCVDYENTYPTKTIEIVEKWAEEHPQKTILMDFLEKFPKAKLGEDGVPYYCCPSELGYEDEKNCRDCACIDCWNRPI